jgi:hypothetical protein
LISVNPVTKKEKVIILPALSQVYRILPKSNIILWRETIGAISTPSPFPIEMSYHLYLFDDDFNLIKELDSTSNSFNFSGYADGYAYFNTYIMNPNNSYIQKTFRINEQGIEEYKLKKSSDMANIYNGHMLYYQSPESIVTYTNFDGDFSYQAPSKMYLQFCQYQCRMNDENVLVMGGLNGMYNTAFRIEDIKKKNPIPILTSIDNGWSGEMNSEEVNTTSGAGPDNNEIGKIRDKNSIIFKYQPDVYVFLSNLN